MSDGRRNWVTPLLLLLVVTALFYFQRARMGIDLIDAADAAPAPRIEVRDAEGIGHSLDDLRGRVVVINLWADWCGPCRREVPRLTRLQAEFAERGLVLWAVNADALAGDRLRESAERLGIGYPVFESVRGLADLGGGSVLPYTWMIDRQGRVRAAHGGLPSESSLRHASKKLLAETTSR